MKVQCVGCLEEDNILEMVHVPYGWFKFEFNDKRGIRTTCYACETCSTAFTMPELAKIKEDGQ